MVSLAIEIYTGHAENFDRFGERGKKLKTFFEEINSSIWNLTGITGFSIVRFQRPVYYHNTKTGGYSVILLFSIRGPVSRKSR